MSDTTETTDTTTTATEDKPAKVEFSPEQNEWIGKKIAYELKAAQEKRDAADADAKTKAETERQRKIDEEKGKFDEVRQSIEQERDTYKSQLDDATSELTELRTLAESRLADLLKDIPKEIAELGPDNDTPITRRLNWAEKAAKAAGKTKIVRGNGADPKGGNAPKENAASPLSLDEIMNG